MAAKSDEKVMRFEVRVQMKNTGKDVEREAHASFAVADCDDAREVAMEYAREVRADYPSQCLAIRVIRVVETVEEEF